MIAAVLLALVALAAAATAAAAAPVPLPKVGGADEIIAAAEAVGRWYTGQAADASELVDRVAENFVADFESYPEELPLARKAAGRDEALALVALWRAQLAAGSTSTFVVMRADPMRRTAVVTVSSDLEFTRSGRSVRAEELLYLQFAPGRPVATGVRAALLTADAVVAAFRVRSEDLFHRFHGAMSQGGPSADPVKKLLSKKVVASVNNNHGDIWPEPGRGVKGFGTFLEAVGRTVQWRPRRIEVVEAGETDITVIMHMEVHLFTGDRKDFLPVAHYLQFDKEGLLTAYTLTVLGRITQSELSPPSSPMGMPPMGGDAVPDNLRFDGLDAQVYGGGGGGAEPGGAPVGRGPGQFKHAHGGRRDL